MTLKLAAATGSMILLAACSSGGGTQYDTLATSGAEKIYFSGKNNSGSYNGGTGTITLNGSSGKLTNGGTAAVLSDGTSLAISRGGASYSAVYAASGANSGFGAFGVKTRKRDLPIAGSARYSGITTVVVANDNGLYDLKGDAGFVVDFANDIAALELNNLDGVLRTGTSKSTKIKDFGQISIVDIAISGAALSGGQASVTSSRIDKLSNKNKADITGAFFGPGADEAAGKFEIDDTNNGDSKILGNFIVD